MAFWGCCIISVLWFSVLSLASNCLTPVGLHVVFTIRDLLGPIFDLCVDIFHRFRNIFQNIFSNIFYIYLSYFHMEFQINIIVVLPTSHISHVISCISISFAQYCNLDISIVLSFQLTNPLSPILFKLIFWMISFRLLYVFSSGLSIWFFIVYS